MSWGRGRPTSRPRWEGWQHRPPHRRLPVLHQPGIGGRAGDRPRRGRGGVRARPGRLRQHRAEAGRQRVRGGGGTPLRGERARRQRRLRPRDRRRRSSTAISPSCRSRAPSCATGSGTGSRTSGSTARTPSTSSDRVEVTHQRQEMHSDQLTWQVTPRNKLALQVQRDPLRHDNVGVSTVVTEESAHAFERGGTTTSLTWTAPYSARVFAEGLRSAAGPRGGGLSPGPGGGQPLRALRCGSPLSTRTCPPTSARRSRAAASAAPTPSTRETAASASRCTVRSPSRRGRRGPSGTASRRALSVENERYFRQLSRGIEGTLHPTSFWTPQLGTLYTELHVPYAYRLGGGGIRGRALRRGPDPLRFAPDASPRACAWTSRRARASPRKASTRRPRRSASTSS